MQNKALGIDVSFWQDNNTTPQQVNWRKAKAAGAVFAFIKASQAAYTDEDFEYNWKEAKAAGILMPPARCLMSPCASAKQQRSKPSWGEGRAFFSPHHCSVALNSIPGRKTHF